MTWGWIGPFASDNRRRQHRVRPHGARLAVEFRCAGLVGYSIGRIPGGPSDN